MVTFVSLDTVFSGVDALNFDGHTFVNRLAFSSVFLANETVFFFPSLKTLVYMSLFLFLTRSLSFCPNCIISKVFLFVFIVFSLEIVSLRSIDVQVASFMMFTYDLADDC